MTFDSVLCVRDKNAFVTYQKVYRIEFKLNNSFIVIATGK